MPDLDFPSTGIDGGNGEILIFRSKLGEKILITRVHALKEEHDLENKRYSNQRVENATMWPSNLDWNLWMLSFAPCVSLNKTRRVVKELEIDKGQKWSLRTWSISKPLPK